ncbi:conserved hypothetical protein [Candidatus Koribacter versatilis Ellin345]|uniref:Nicotinamide mononucleotide adenylyltransferase n=1 Tax=Koribacter versatilis (strain Ellin345) TaxID=204669 RepID=Q1IUL4_KORVE|nr:hypothetical protein [Candidatus Koribacter versatilis]ABF39436.1 conserved hypothetical protein [Candidatus Koribacter versatilis Ellin345]
MENVTNASPGQIVIIPPAEKLDAHRKALTLNLDTTAFGSFAEIGAGQEVARWFLIVGGASGTVAKTISAYDKQVSDDLYGAGSRYVSRERLEAMLENEWAQLLTQLQSTRGSNTRFFSFVDTVSARNHAGTNDPHGWVGLRFQSAPGGPFNDILLHINMRDPSNVLQQEVIGVLGVNLIFAAFYQLTAQESFFGGVTQDLPKERVEIDFVDFRGPAFEGWNRHEVQVYLVHAGFAEAVFFSSKGTCSPPTEALYKKAVVLAPGTFVHLDPIHSEIHLHLLAAGVQELGRELGQSSAAPMGFFALSAAPLSPEGPAPDVSDLLRRIDGLLAQGGDVLLFRERELYAMTTLVNRYTKAPMRFVVGLSLSIRAFTDPYYHLQGSLLEALSRLFVQNVRIYAYPMRASELQEAIKDFAPAGLKWDETDGWVTADQLRFASPLCHLHAYLLASNFLVPMKVDPESAST